MSLLSALAALAFFIMPSPVTLYASDLTPLVVLPAGYFVMRTDEPAPDGYIAVVYDDLTGLVEARAVDAVDYTPVKKYETTVRFKCDNDGQPVNLRAAPRKNAQILTVLDANAIGRCYGTLEGDALIPACGGLWYYVNAGAFRGYCYGAHLSVGAFPPNIIEKEPEEDEEPAAAEADPPQAMSKTAAIILIVALCIPVPFIMFYLFRKPKD